MRPEDTQLASPRGPEMTAQTPREALDHVVMPPILADRPWRLYDQMKTDILTTLAPFMRTPLKCSSET